MIFAGVYIFSLGREQKWNGKDVSKYYGCIFDKWYLAWGKLDFFGVWGGVHGAACVMNRVFYKSWDKLNLVCQWIITFAFVNVAWFFFRANSISDALTFLKRIVFLQGYHISNELIESFALPEIQFLMGNLGKGYLWMWLFIGIAFWMILGFKNCSEIEKKTTMGKGVLTVVCMVWSIISFAGISTFLYFNF